MGHKSGGPDYQFAARRGKETLYKFRPFHTCEDRKRVREIVVKHKVYFSRASQINDPFDLSPRMAKITREELIAGAERHFRRKPEMLANRDKILLHLTSCDLAEHVTEATHKARQRIEKGYSIFSLAGNRTHPMLWSHYAGGHTGLCIHFHSNERAIFGGAQEVKYNAQRPILPIQAFDGPEHEIYQRVLLTKGEFWAYEDEYRWILFPDIDWSGLSISFSGQHAKFAPSELSGITVGARMSKSVIANVLRMAAKHDPQLPVWRAVENETFEFDFEQIG